MTGLNAAQVIVLELRTVHKLFAAW